MSTFALTLVLSVFAACHCIPTNFGYGSGSNVYGYGQEEHHEAKPYHFGYSVKDFKKGTNFNQHETSDGHNVKGQYAVALPDGRMQIVTYYADWKNGYHADVKYVGEAHHPQVYANTHGHDTPSSDYGYAGAHPSSTHFQNLGTASHGHSTYPATY